MEGTQPTQVPDEPALTIEAWSGPGSLNRIKTVLSRLRVQGPDKLNDVITQSADKGWTMPILRQVDEMTPRYVARVPATAGLFEDIGAGGITPLEAIVLTPKADTETKTSIIRLFRKFINPAHDDYEVIENRFHLLVSTLPDAAQRTALEGVWAEPVKPPKLSDLVVSGGRRKSRRRHHKKSRKHTRKH
jgi:hypothetical protein